MGDRANVCIIGNDGRGRGKGAVFFYTHWKGDELDKLVHNGLSRRLRHGDTPYLRRIIFCEIIKGHESEETGFGISSGLIFDNAHPIIVVDDTKKIIGLATEMDPKKLFHSISYDAFIDDREHLRYHEFDSDGNGCT